MTSFPSSAANNRVLIVAEYGVMNGGERSLLSVLPHLQERGWEFVAVVPVESEFEKALREIGVATREFKKEDSAAQRFSQKQLREQLREIFLAVQPTIVHANSLAASRLCGPLTRELGIRSVGYLRDIVKLSRQAIKDINRIDRLVAVSQATLDWHVAQGLDPLRVQVIYNGVDLDVFSPLSVSRLQMSYSQDEKHSRFNIRNELGIPLNCPLTLFVGQIGMRKGVDLLVDAFLKVAERRGDVHLIVVGERNSTKQEAIDFENRIRAQVRSPQCPASVSSRIHWLGRRDDVPELMKQSTLLIHPARQEPFGRVLLEAAASGLPIITTNVGGSPEMLKFLDFHRIVQPIDEAAISNRALELLGNREECSELSGNLRTLAESCYSDKSTADRLERVYRELTGQVENS